LAADTKAEFTFGALRAATPEAGKAQAEAWLKKAGKFDQAAFDKIWANEDASVLDRTLATFELGSEDAKKILASARLADVTAPKNVPAVLKDEKQDTYFRANLALGFARGLTNGRVYEESLVALSTVKAEQTVDPSAYFFHRAVAEHALIKKDDAMRSIVRLIDDVSDAPDRYKISPPSCSSTWGTGSATRRTCRTSSGSWTTASAGSARRARARSLRTSRRRSSSGWTS
jgi:hypothetical protein